MRDMKRAVRPDFIWVALLAVFSVVLGSIGGLSAHFYLIDAENEGPLGVRGNLVVENVGDPNGHARITELIRESTERHGVTLYKHAAGDSGWDVFPNPAAHDDLHWHAVSYPGGEQIPLTDPMATAGPASGSYSFFGAQEDVVPVLDELRAAGVEAWIDGIGTPVLWILGGSVGDGWAAAIIMAFLVIGLAGMLSIAALLRARSLQRSAGMSFARRWAPTIFVLPIVVAVLAMGPLILLSVLVAVEIGRPAAAWVLSPAVIIGLGASAAAVIGMSVGLAASARISLPERLAGVMPVRTIGAIAGVIAVGAVATCGYGVRDAYATHELSAKADWADQWREAHPSLVVPQMGYEVRGERGDSSTPQLREVAETMYAQDKAMLSTVTEGFSGGEAVLIDASVLAAVRPDLLDRVADAGVTMLTPTVPGPEDAITADDLRDMTQFWAELRGDADAPTIYEATYDERGDADLVVPLLSYQYASPGDSFRVNPVLVVAPDPPTVMQPAQLVTDSAYTDADQYRDLVQKSGAADVIIGVESVAETSVRDARRREMQTVARLTGAVAAIAVALLSTGIAAWSFARLRRPQVFLRRCVGDGFMRIHGATVAAAALAGAISAALGVLAFSTEPLPVAVIAPIVGVAVAAVVAGVFALSFRSTTVIALEEI